MRGPSRLKLGPGCDDDQNGFVLNAIGEQLERFMRRRIDPMRIFEDNQQRLVTGQPDKVVRQRTDRRVSLLLGREHEGRVAMMRRDRQ